MTLSKRDVEAMPAGEAPTVVSSKHVVTREALMDGSLVARIRAAVARENLDVGLRSDLEIEAALEEALAVRPDPATLWIFGYGSLLWNITFRHIERRCATLHGWHRQFCAWSPLARGTPETPGLILALEEGGHTEGVAFRFPPAEERQELQLIFRREVFSDSYNARWVTVETDAGPVPALTFVANPHSRCYAGELSEEEIVEALARAKGSIGTAADYLRETVTHLDQLGLRDDAFARINRLVQARVV